MGTRRTRPVYRRRGERRVLLDWKGVVAHKFGFRDNVSNVYVIDREGVLRYAGSGQAANAEVKLLFRALDGLLRR